MFDVEKIRDRFALIHHTPIAYLDNTATTQKPVKVIQAMTRYYEHYNANVHRGVHTLSDMATEKFEEARQVMADFIGAQKNEIVWTRGTTESINIVAQCLFDDADKLKGKSIVVTALEHHSNLVPWQMVCQKYGMELKVIDLDEYCDIDMDHARELIDEDTFMVAVTHISNVTGTLNPINELVSVAKEFDSYTLIDAAQSIGHQKIDVREIDCDFLCASGHKMYGPTGIGILYGKEHVLERMGCYHFGGEMVDVVTYQTASFNVLPYKFEGGTPNIAGAIGMATASKVIREIGFEDIHQHEMDLIAVAEEVLTAIDGVRIIGKPKERRSNLSFVTEFSAFDIGSLLNNYKVAVRTGTHCAQPLMGYLGVEGTVRASVAVYTSIDEIERLGFGVKKALKLLRG